LGPEVFLVVFRLSTNAFGIAQTAGVMSDESMLRVGGVASSLEEHLQHLEQQAAT
jgi:hypothetical protein